MKNEEDKISLNNNINKNILNCIMSYNSNSNNDFKKISGSNYIINTSGSQPIIIFKKISKSLTQAFPNNKQSKPIKNNYVSDGGIKKKISKYKSFSSNPNLINPSVINVLGNNNNKIEKAENNNNRLEKEPKTTRNINKKLFVNLSALISTRKINYR